MSLSSKPRFWADGGQGSTLPPWPSMAFTVPPSLTALNQWPPPYFQSHPTTAELPGPRSRATDHGGKEGEEDQEAQGRRAQRKWDSSGPVPPAGEIGPFLAWRRASALLGRGSPCRDHRHCGRQYRQYRATYQKSLANISQHDGPDRHQ
jgi:hypothetical protein